MEAVLASLAWWLTLIISAKASSPFSWQKSTAADQRDLVFIKEEEEFLWAKSGTISLLFAKLLMCHVRMESSTGLVTETNGVLDLAKVNMQKKKKPKKQWLSTPACHIWGSAVFPSTPIPLNLDLDLTWRYFFLFVLLVIVTLDINILQSMKWKNNCICGPYQKTRDPHRAHCSAWQHHHAHQILWAENKTNRSVCATLRCWSCTVYLWAHLPPSALPQL